MKDKDGKMYDVLIEDVILEDKSTGIKSVSEEKFIVWANAGLKDTIEKVPGVFMVGDVDAHYFISVDPRYDFEFVKREVEAVLIIKSR